MYCWWNQIRFIEYLSHSQFPNKVIIIMAFVMIINKLVIYNQNVTFSTKVHCEKFSMLRNKSEKEM